MSNTIKGLNGPGSPPAAALNGRTAASPSDTSATGGPEAADRVTLTETAKRLQAAEQRALDSSGIDRQRVEQIRTALAEGGYRVDARRVAQGLLAVERELFGKP